MNSVPTKPNDILVITGNRDLSDDFSAFISEIIIAHCGLTTISNRLGANALEYELDINKSCDDLNAFLKKRFWNVELDFNVVPKLGRKKKILFADMDSTLIANECIDELASFFGNNDKISRITQQTMEGELDFIESFKGRVALLKGLPEHALQQTFDDRINLNAGAVILGETLAKHAVKTVIVSSGFDFFTDRVASAAGFKMAFSNALDIKNGVLTGLIKEPIMGPEGKRAIFDSQCRDNHLDPIQTMSVGDGANDIPMIKAAGLGVAYHAKPTVEKSADVSIKYADLTALLYLQGYYQAEFADPC